ncbi:TPA: hypothetical protein KPG21_000271 [Clostridioides difficile]|nr:hypothetical protein [Clostridioides difficile]MBY2557970.1 hypothetical protein [Clostridioides difficile]MCL6900253.1 hypothetical protein [Clostridioides difficile]MDE3492450.1 hypothetical protein [Clostridioides difficile]MDE3706929.1 hypothetical protein [Clostridioides difficile]
MEYLVLFLIMITMITRIINHLTKLIDAISNLKTSIRKLKNHQTGGSSDSESNT